jgi:membrane dipeptidase
MNEKTFWDAKKIVTRPILVSHGNARALCDSPRNYNDEQLRAIGETDGVIGLFLSKKFLTKNDTVNIDGVIAHITHIISVAGERAIALGSDFGGIVSGFSEGLTCVSELEAFIDTLPKNLLFFRVKMLNVFY